MTRLSDEEICTLGRNRYQALGMDEELLFKRGYRHRENELIPQIEKLQGEVESLSKSNLSLKQLAQDMAEKSNKEIARLKELGYTTLNDYREESKMRIEAEKELAQLTAKHERLVKAAQEFHDYVIIHPVKAFDVPDEIYVPFNNALTEEGNV